MISTVRTAQAFGTQAKLTALYDEYVVQALVVDSKAALYHGESSIEHSIIIFRSYEGMSMNSLFRVLLQAAVLAPSSS